MDKEDIRYIEEMVDKIHDLKNEIDYVLSRQHKSPSKSNRLIVDIEAYIGQLDIAEQELATSKETFDLGWLKKIPFPTYADL